MLHRNTWWFAFILMVGWLSMDSADLLAGEISTQEILQTLRAHQKKIQSIQADLVMTIFGVDHFQLEQSGTYQFTAPDQVVMEFQKPQPQIIKTQGQETYISFNGKPFQKLSSPQEQPGANQDLFYCQFIQQFYLDIDFKNKPTESQLYKILAYQKNADGTLADSQSVLNFKAADFIYDRDRGLITQMNFMGNGPVPPIEVKLTYEEKSGCWVPKAVFTKVITPGGAIVSTIQFQNKEVKRAQP